MTVETKAISLPVENNYFWMMPKAGHTKGVGVALFLHSHPHPS